MEYDYEINVGDTLYCIRNNGVEQELSIGEPYTIEQIWTKDLVIFRIKETESRWMKFRFSPNPNHPLIIKHNQKKFQI